MSGLAVLVAMLLTPVIASAAWYDGNWSFRKLITIQSSQVVGDQTAFPVLINLASDVELAASARADGHDILFTDSDEVTKLDHEIEKYVSLTGELAAWVKIPNLPSTVDKEIYMYYGHSSSPDQQSPSVWTAGFMGVWHFNDDFDDATTNGYHGTNNGSTDIGGMIADGQEFDGIDDYVDVSSMNPQNYDDFTASAWYRSTDASVSDDEYIFQHDVVYSQGPGFALTATDDPGDIDHLRLSIYDNSTDFHPYYGTSDIVDQQYHYVVGVRGSGRIRLYVDGVKELDVLDQDAGETLLVNAPLGPIIGDYPGETEQVHGILDEVRIADVMRTDGWVATEFNNQSNPAGFYVLGAQVSAPRTISGTVFEDADFAGTATDFDGGVNDAGQPFVDVELYGSGDAYINSTTTDAGGNFSFSGLSDGAYKVRVRSATLGDADTPPAGGLNATVPATWPYPLAEMTYGHGSALYGGQNAVADDTATADNAGPGDSYLDVTVSGSDVTGVNFGFAYNLIVHIADDANADNVRSRQGSLRQFIKNSNAIGASGGTTANISEFRMQVAANQSDSADSWWRVACVRPLPAIADAATIVAGSTQRTNSGADSNSRGPEIEIHGSAVTGDGISVSNTSGTLLKELTINSFGGMGVRIDGAAATGNAVLGCYVGVDGTGENALGNADFGIWLRGNSSNNDIGGPDPGDGNVISGNGDLNTETGISLSSTDNIRVRGNKIGTDRTGTKPVGNMGPGISILDSEAITIGGATAGAGNIISGNGNAGIRITNWSRDLTIIGNRIGTGITGTETNLGNGGAGCLITGFFDPSNVIIGGDATAGNLIAYNQYGIYTTASGQGDEIIGNTIRNNDYHGIYSATDGLLIARNLIFGNGALGSDGVVLNDDGGTGASNNRVFQNTIHGNDRDGIEITGSGAILRNNVITGNGNYGINVNGGSMTESHNLVTDAVTVPANGSGRSNVALDAADLNADPQFVDAAGDDFTLVECSSPAINAGLDLGIDQPDMNGDDPGRFNGSAPDGGALETTCLGITHQISGIVFEDVDFAGIATGWDGGASDIAQPNADVELYGSGDIYITSATTDAGGNYSFSGLPDGTYKVRVRSATLGDADTPPAGGLNATVPATWPYPLPEMTWAAGGALIGGQDHEVDDTATADDAGPGDTYGVVTVSGADVAGVNFGFCFDLIVNEDDDANADSVRSKQGTLRQFIKNANAIVGLNRSQFNIPGL